jgi:hypothetical protein
MIGFTLTVILTSLSDLFFALLHLPQSADESVDLVEGNESSFVPFHWAAAVSDERVLHNGLHCKRMPKSPPDLRPTSDAAFPGHNTFPGHNLVP